MTDTLSTARAVDTSPAAIEGWLHAYIAELRGMKPERISRTVPLYKYGLDSASAVTLTGDLMDWLGVDVDPAVLYEHPTIEKAAAHLSSLCGTTR
jgi:acyl carrier protein